MRSTTFLASAVTDGVLNFLKDGRYTGPNIEWTCLALASACPPIQERLSPESVAWEIDDQGRSVTEIALQAIFQAGVENGYRMASDESAGEPLQIDLKGKSYAITDSLLEEFPEPHIAEIGGVE